MIEGEARKSLADLVALNIGQMGENMALGHIDFFASPPGDQNVVFASEFCGSGSCNSLTIYWPDGREHGPRPHRLLCQSARSSKCRLCISVWWIRIRRCFLTDGPPRSGSVILNYVFVLGSLLFIKV